MVSKCRKCHLRETEFANFPGAEERDTPGPLLQARAFGAEKYALIFFKTQTGLESLQVRQTCVLDDRSIEEPNSEDKHLYRKVTRSENIDL